MYCIYNLAAISGLASRLVVDRGCWQSILQQSGLLSTQALTDMAKWFVSERSFFLHAKSLETPSQFRVLRSLD